jgi:uncharacterized integral membrane protein
MAQTSGSDLAEAGRGQDPTPRPVPNAPIEHQRRTRLSAAWVATVTFTIISVLLLVFMLQNLHSVEIHYLGVQGRLPLAVALLIAVLGGAVLVAAAGGLRILQLRLQARRTRRTAR